MPRCTLVCYICRERGHIARNCPEVVNVRLIYQAMSNRDFARRSPRGRGGGRGGTHHHHVVAATTATTVAAPANDTVAVPETNQTDQMLAPCPSRRGRGSGCGSSTSSPFDFL